MSSPVYKKSLTVDGVWLDVVIVEEFDQYWFAQCIQLDTVNRAAENAWRAFEQVSEVLIADIPLMKAQGIRLENRPPAPLD
ncbi:MAG: hypothetical protein KW802_02995 [Candidatus Doudnabacteria bacterium]|nr:hypothetical protein [Candidatus Doudnabacteria bacterium]